MERWITALEAIVRKGITITTNPIITPQLEGTLKATLDEMKTGGHDENIEPVPGLLDNMNGYGISRVAVRGAIFKDDAILLVRAPFLERESWALPGGSAEINESPSQAIRREVLEETGFEVDVEKLVAVSSFTHPRWSGTTLNLFFQCNIQGGRAATSAETDEIAFFTEEEVSTLETWGPTGDQIPRLYSHHRNPALPTEVGVAPWV